MIPIRTAAAPHACWWSTGSACSAEVKMNIGIEAIGSPRVVADRVAVERAREEERRRLAGRARGREGRARDDSADRLRQDDAQGRPPLRGAQREARLAHRGRDQGEHLLGRARDHRNHQDREREARLPRRLPVADDDEDEDEDAEHDRRDPVQHVEREREHARPASGARARSGRSRSARRPAAPSGARADDDQRSR